jgi:hypothetical protein
MENWFEFICKCDNCQEHYQLINLKSLLELKD